MERIWELTRIDKWFLYKLRDIVRMTETISGHTLAQLPADLLLRAKKLGFADKQIGALCQSTELAVRQVCELARSC